MVVFILGTSCSRREKDWVGSCGRSSQPSGQQRQPEGEGGWGGFHDCGTQQKRSVRGWRWWRQRRWWRRRSRRVVPMQQVQQTLVLMLTVQAGFWTNCPIRPLSLLQSGKFFGMSPWFFVIIPDFCSTFLPIFFFRHFPNTILRCFHLWGFYHLGALHYIVKSSDIFWWLYVAV